MLQIAAPAIRALRLPGGELFTAFVDGLIRTHTGRHNIPDAAIETNSRTNIGDQGADTIVQVPLAAETTGRFNVPTVWQYKATDYASVGSAARLLEGDFVRARISEAFTFSLAVADSITPAQRGARVEALNALCREMNPAAPPALVVSVDDLVEWANRYPAYVLHWGDAPEQGDFVHLRAWGPSVTAATPTFVAVARWDAVAAELRRHVSFAEDPPTVIFSIQGEAGVGKSRLVYEVLHALPGMDGLVLYSNDEEASVQVARRLANAEAPAPVSAVLVADECGVGGRELIRQLLQGHRNRVRVIVIDNSGRRPAAGDPESWLEKMPEQSLEQILFENFQEIPRERRRAYADLARGYPRLAADLCRHDALIAAAGGDVRPAIASVREYLTLRLSPEQQQSLAAVSFVTKIGYRGEVGGEIDSLCQLLRIDWQRTIDALHEIRGGPGFIVVAGRYFYVTPEIIAHVGFADAWRRWASDEPNDFLARIPASLLQAFLDRVQKSAGEEVRRVCGDYFRGWVAHLRPTDLADISIANRFAQLVETDPPNYLPRLRRIIDESSLETLRQISGRSSHGYWGSRRVLVWLAERLARFPDYFDDAEGILLRMAAAESEPDIGNNATGIWIQLFRIRLSGTAVPFTKRVSLLRERLRSQTPEIRKLGVSALEAIFSDSGMRMEGSPVIAGRIPPDEWNPQTRRELFDAERRALGLVGEAIKWGDPTVSLPLRNILVGDARWFALHGLVEEVEVILRPIQLTEDEKLRLIDSLGQILAYDASHHTAELVQHVNRWRQSLSSGDLPARMVAVIGQTRWGAARLQDESTWLEDIAQLADEFIAQGTSEDLLWLFQRKAHAAGGFGFAVGRGDTRDQWLDATLRNALEHEHRSFARGYVHGSLSRPNPPVEQINAWLDHHEQDAPTVVAELAQSGGEQLNAFQRVIRLADRRVIPATFLFDRNFSTGNQTISEDRFEALMERLVVLAEEGDKSALQIGLDAIGLRIHGGHAAAALERDRIRNVVWRLIERAITTPLPVAERYTNVLKALGAFDGLRAARLAVRQLVGDHYADNRQAEKVLSDLAKRDPSAVMQALGEAVVDDKTGWKFYVHSFKALVGSLPTEVVKSWIASAGLEGARRLARHLPAPYLKAGETPIVPDLTAWVLTEFEEDDRVFKEFAAGVHSFKLYAGDIAAPHEAEATVARAFLDHPIRRVREWAEREERWAMDAARQEREEAEERDLP